MSGNVCTKGAKGKGHVLTLRSAAYCVVSEASAPLLEVGTRRASVSRRDRHLAAPLCAADPTRRRAR